MNKLTFVPLFGLLALLPCLAAESESYVVNADSQIDAVTVFPEYARVSRLAECQLQEGVNLVRLGGLPEFLLTDSIQVEGQANVSVKILDVRVESESHTEVANITIRILKEELVALNDKKSLNGDKLAILKGSLEYLNGIRQYMTTHPNEGNQSKMPDLDKWLELIAFQEKETERIFEKMRDLRLSNFELDREIRRVESELKRSNSELYYETKTVLVSLDAESPTDFSLNFSYMVEDAYWSPVYDVYVDLDKSELELVMKAAVQQSSLEDWTNVQMTLSTAKPATDGEVPVMSAWRVRKLNTLKSKSVIGDADSQEALQRYSLATEVAGLTGNFAGVRFEGGEVDVYELSEFLDSQEDSSLASTEFVLPYRLDLPSSEDPQQVRIAAFTVESHIYHMSMSRVSDTTFLKARSVNPASYPLLPGPTQVFLDGRFVARSRIEYRATGEEMNFLLGGSSRVKVERELVNRFDETVGFGGKSSRVTFEYLYTLSNNDAKTQLIVLRDQIPVSGNEEIIVSLIEPKTNTVDLDEVGMLIWRLNLEPGESREVKLVFSVQYPKNWALSGL